MNDEHECKGAFCTDESHLDPDKDPVHGVELPTFDSQITTEELYDRIDWVNKGEHTKADLLAFAAVYTKYQLGKALGRNEENEVHDIMVKWIRGESAGKTIQQVLSESDYVILKKQ
jgi:hypothetical protein